MEKTLTIICAIVLIAVAGYLGYTIHTGELRTKELDKKRADKLDAEKEIYDLALEKLKNGKLNTISIERNADTTKTKMDLPSANGNRKKKKVDVAKHTEGK